MLNPNKKIYEIALESGYDNIPYFSTAFRKYTGYSPSEIHGIRYDSKRNTGSFQLDCPLIKSRFLYFLIFLNNISLSDAVPLGFHNRNHLIHIVLTGLHVSCLYHNADQRLCS